MRHYRIIFLLLSSLLLSSCAYNKLAAPSKRFAPLNQGIINPVILTSGAIKYKTSIDILNKHFTGLIVLKQTDRETKHLVFVTELGMRMFDFEMKGDSMKPVFVFEALNKPKLVSALVRNFTSILLIEWFNNGAWILEKQGKEYLHLKRGTPPFMRDIRHQFLFTDDKKYATKLQVFKKRKKESKIIYSGNYENIKLKQYGLVKLYIEMDKINE